MFAHYILIEGANTMIYNSADPPTPPLLRIKTSFFETNSIYFSKKKYRKRMTLDGHGPTYRAEKFSSSSSSVSILLHNALSVKTDLI